MTIRMIDTVACRMCGAVSQHISIGSTSSIGASDLDFRPPERARSTIDCWLQECPECGYVAVEIAGVEAQFTDGPPAPEPPAEPEEGVDAIMRKAEWRALAAMPPKRYRRFLKRSLIDETLGNLAQAGEWALNAAWAADDEADGVGLDASLSEEPVDAADAAAAAKTARIRAAALLAKALENNAVEPKEVLDHQLRLIDVLRRAGKWPEAAAICEQLSPLANKTAAAILAFQRQRIAAKDDGGYTLADVDEFSGA